jgi:ADP-ribose pyrophosphatase YjhB (NUDIX family)
LLREILEETGLTIRIGGLIDVAEFIEREAKGGTPAHFVLIDFSTHWVEGQARAASDVAECGWFTPKEAIGRVLWDETQRMIRASARRVWNINL